MKTSFTTSCRYSGRMHLVFLLHCFLLLCSIILLLPTTTLAGDAEEEGEVSENGEATEDEGPLPITGLSEPQELWRALAGDISEDNGVYISPDGEMVVSTSLDGRVHAFDATNGDTLWVYEPDRPAGSDESVLRCNSGISFSYNSEQRYLVYSIVDNPRVVPSSRVIGLNPSDGAELWESLTLEGAAAGSPIVSHNGRHIFLTHNSNEHAIGHFTVLDTDLFEYSTIFPIYSEFNHTNPFTPPGIYHNPDEGYYPGGEDNTNDIVVWSFAPKPTDELIDDGTESHMGEGSAMFIFQFPADFAEDDSTSPGRLGWRYFGFPNDSWRSVSAPSLTNSGRSVYWAVSRSEFRAWVGEPRADEYRFDTNETLAAEFSMGLLPNAPSPNTPALSNNPLEPLVFGATAGQQFVKMDYLLGEMETINTTSDVKARAWVSPDEQFVYYTEEDGLLHISFTDNLTDLVRVTDFIGNLNSDFAMRQDGTILYLGDSTGEISAFRVGLVPTPAPTAGPTLEPTLGDRNLDTPAPTVDPSAAVSLHTYQHGCWLFITAILLFTGPPFHLGLC